MVGAAIAYFVSKQQNIPTSIAFWLAAAYLLEIAFYLVPGFSWSKALVDSVEPPPVRAFLLLLSGLAPYVLYSVGTGTFHWRSFGYLALIATITSAWFVMFDRPWTDILFAGILTALILSNIFDSIYVTLAPKADPRWLGRLMLVHTSVIGAVSVRRSGQIGFGFIPTASDWVTGILCYGGALIASLAANHWVQLVHLQLRSGPWWQVAGIALGTFLGFLWAASLLEEFVSRGLVQQALNRIIGPIASLIVITILFGLVHLPYNHKFPNWKQAAMAGVLGLFCGIAYQKAGNIRASTITHALMVATWRTFFVS